MDIGKSKQTTGHDLEDLRHLLGIRTLDMCFAYAISITAWSQMTRVSNEPSPADPINQPVPPVFALSARLLARRPELCPVPVMPTFDEMFSIIKDVAPNITIREFAVLSGSEASAGYRWQKGEAVSSFTQRRWFIMRSAFDRCVSVSERARVFAEIRQDVEEEARAAGVENIWKSGKWKPQAVIEKTKKSKTASTPRKHRAAESD